MNISIYVGLKPPNSFILYHTFSSGHLGYANIETVKGCTGLLF